MKHLLEIIRKFSNKYMVTKPLPVLLRHSSMIDDPHEAVGIFGKHFEDLCSRTNYPHSFIKKERDLVGRIPDFGTDNRDNYNRTFTLTELQDAIRRSGSISVGLDEVHCDFIRHLAAIQPLVDELRLPRVLEAFLHYPNREIIERLQPGRVLPPDSTDIMPL